MAQIKTCRYCGNPIDFVYSEKTGKFQCVEYDPVFIIEQETGNWYVDENGDKVYGREFNRFSDKVEDALAVFVPHGRMCRERQADAGIKTRGDIQAQVKGTKVKCRYCGKDIAFIRNPKTGKSMPVNAEEKMFIRTNRGHINLIDMTGNLIRCELTDDFRKSDGVGYEPHWGDCTTNKG